MAKKKRKDEVEAEKYEWKPPDFDEKAFLRTDVKGTRALFISAIVGIIIGFLTFAIGTFSPILGGVVLLAGVFSLRYILRFLKTGEETLKLRSLAGNALLLFFLALAVWIILMNAPFSDIQAPQISSKAVNFNDGSSWHLYVSDTATPIHSGNQVNITAVVRDNGVITGVKISVAGVTSGFEDMTPSAVKGGYVFTRNYTASGSPASFSYTIKATDGAGHETMVNGSFVVNP